MLGEGRWALCCGPRSLLLEHLQLHEQVVFALNGNARLQIRHLFRYLLRANILISLHDGSGAVNVVRDALSHA